MREHPPARGRDTSLSGRPDDLAAKLLGGVARRHARKRGFVPWEPKEGTKAILAQINEVLEEYAAYLPLTCRQVFYRLVGTHGYPKTEGDYARLCEILNRARRAQLINMDAIRDDGGQSMGGPGWKSVDQFIHSIRRQATELRLDRTTGQPIRLAVFCEASGMVPQLADVCEPFDIPVTSSGGFESVTEKYRLAKELAERDRPTEVLHIGDHDPSGTHLFLALAEDVSAFAQELGAPQINFTRLAVTPEQIEQLGLETAPPKVTDRRAFHGETCQAEAIAPDELARILREAIEERIDYRALQQVLGLERKARRELRKRLVR
jgi:hypothetical protein